MIDLIAKNRLEKRGYSSGKKRRKVIENEFLDALRNGVTARIALIVGFALFTTLLVVLSRDDGAIFAQNRIQAALVVNVIVVTMVIQLQINHPASYSQNGRLLLMLGAVLAHLLLFELVLAQSRSGIIPVNYAFLLPIYALAPMLLSILLGRNHGTFAATYVSLLGALLVEKDLAIPFIIISLVSGFIAVYLTHQVRRRSTVVYAGFFVGLATMLLAVATGQIPLTGIPISEVAQRCGSTVMMGVVTSMIISGSLPILENVFRITTEASWLEMADLNHPLLKRLTFEAPGTYHHSLVVARLAESAADAVGANGPMCRVASYFHDIGKLTKPQYFIENLDRDENPHERLTPTMSALIITAHVKDGVDLALKNNLNSTIIDVIREHHGTSLVQFFYAKALEDRANAQRLIDEGKVNPEDLPLVDEKSFRYAGPCPRSRESAIISLADSIESASRAMTKPTAPKIQQIIDDIVESRLKDGQLDHCRLTLSDIRKVKQSFHANLCAMNHNRVAYPNLPDPALQNAKATTKSKSHPKSGAHTKKTQPVPGNTTDASAAELDVPAKPPLPQPATEPKAPAQS